MPKTRGQQELKRRLALLGAQVRLDAIEAERQSIEAFMRSVAGRATGTVSDGTPLLTPARRRKRQRRPMSVAARHAVSERMKKYWADRRAQKAAGGPALRSTKKR